jgi:hypothetical protein
MNEIVMLIFTGVIAVATVVYTYYSIKLWKATRRSTDISRYTLFINFMWQFHLYVEEVKQLQRPDATFLERFENAVLEHGLEDMMRDVNIKKLRTFAEFIARFDGMLRANGVDPESIPWLRPILRKLKE